MHQPKLEHYTVFIRMTVVGESPDDAIEYANNAVDNSDLLDQDGVVGIELVDDADSIELVDEEEDEDEGEL